MVYALDVYASESGLVRALIFHMNFIVSCDAQENIESRVPLAQNVFRFCKDYPVLRDKPALRKAFIELFVMTENVRAVD